MLWQCFAARSRRRRPSGDPHCWLPRVSSRPKPRCQIGAPEGEGARQGAEERPRLAAWRLSADAGAGARDRRRRTGRPPLLPGSDHPASTSPGTPATQALEVLDYLRGNTWPALRSLRAVCRRIIVAGEAAAPADLEVLATEVEAAPCSAALYRQWRRGHWQEGDLGRRGGGPGVPPLRYWPPPPRRAMSGPKAKAGPKKGRAKGRGRVA